MGYDLHITRKENWSEEDGEDIPLDEWIEYIDSDSEMRLDGKAAATTDDGELLVIESLGLAVWTAYSKNDFNGNYAWFYHRAGEWL